MKKTIKRVLKKTLPDDFSVMVAECWRVTSRYKEMLFSKNKENATMTSTCIKIKK